jgi:hypothetical protein
MKHTLFIKILFLATSILTTSCSQTAPTTHDAEREIKNNNFSRAHEILGNIVKNNPKDSKAYEMLGRLYALGEGVEKDIATATSLICTASEVEGTEHFIFAISDMGGLLSPAVSADLHNMESLLECYERWAKRGDDRLLYEMGMQLLGHELGNQSDLLKSKGQGIKFLQDAASKNNGEALYRLGIGYLHGETGFIKNADKAKNLMIEAAQKNNADAQFFLFANYQIDDSKIENIELAYYCGFITKSNTPATDFEKKLTHQNLMLRITSRENNTPAKEIIDTIDIENIIPKNKQLEIQNFAAKWKEETKQKMLLPTK